MKKTVKFAIAAVIIGAALICMLAEVFIYGCGAYLVGKALADGETDCWVLCRPQQDGRMADYINIRRGPGKQHEATGYAESGMRFSTDMEERNGYIHLVGVTEYGDGWISSGYIVFEEPVKVNREMRIRSNGRVACRKTIDGKRRCWVKNGETVTVYAMTRSVAVTNKGFIESRYLEEAGK